MDTFVIIGLLREDEQIIKTLKSKSPDMVATSTFTEYELRFGIESSTDRKAKSNAIHGNFLVRGQYSGFWIKGSGESGTN